MGKPPDPKALAAQPAVAIGLLIGLAVAVNYRFFLSADTLPVHDTGDIFQVFTFAYSNFLFTGTLPGRRLAGLCRRLPPRLAGGGQR